MRRTITALVAAAGILSGAAATAEEPRHLEAAIEAQQRMAAARPDDAGTFNDLGNLLHLDGELEPAQEAYRRALEIDPMFAPALYNLALILQRTGENKAARKALEAVLELDPGHSWGHFQLAMLLDTSKKYSKAAHHYTRAFVIDPDLMEIGRNPQILDTRRATVARAALMAYAERIQQLEAAPRQYNQPDRITRLLVPEAQGTMRQPAARPEADPAAPATEAEMLDQGEDRKLERRQQRMQERRQQEIERREREAQDSNGQSDG